MERKVFSPEEVKFIKAAIMGSTGKDETEKAALAEKVSDVLGGIYRR